MKIIGAKEGEKIGRNPVKREGSRNRGEGRGSKQVTPSQKKNLSRTKIRRHSKEGEKIKGVSEGT